MDDIIYLGFSRTVSLINFAEMHLIPSFTKMSNDRRVQLQRASRRIKNFIQLRD